MEKEKIKRKNIIIRKDIKEPPTEHEITCMRGFGQDINNKCLDCGTPTYYFNQCSPCNEKMIAYAKIMY